MNRRVTFQRLAGSMLMAYLMVLPSMSWAQFGKWTAKESMPTARGAFSTCVVNGKIYAIGGRVGQQKHATVEDYDPAMDQWTRKASMPTARNELSASTVNGKIYAIGGGGDGYTAVEEYDPATDTWTKKANMPTPRRGLSTSVVNDRIYAVGGVGDGTLSVVEAYSPATDTWVRKADMPTERSMLSTDAVNGKIYAIGGYYWDAEQGMQTYCSTVEEYDPATDTWTKKADMPTAREGLSSSTVNGIIYAIGGESKESIALTTVEAYDPASDTWTSGADMSTARRRLSTSVVRGRVYAIGGHPGLYPTVTGTVEELDLRSYSPDFNGNGVVDINDLVRVIEVWGQNEPMFDLVPSPFGDGVVDVQDLEFLMAFWGQEVDDSTLLSCWKLDEGEGNVAFDNAADNDAIVMGEALWQPESGYVDGALQFDGLINHVTTPFVLDAGRRVFSVFAWIKGGEPGQCIISQQGGSGWLAADLSEGQLFTSLSAPSGRSPIPPLISDVVITDGVWHRVGFVWDGIDRILYVDSIEVARDAQGHLEGSPGRLNLGVGAGFEAGSFWSGLIDDVRIYDRVVEP